MNEEGEERKKDIIENIVYLRNGIFNKNENDAGLINRAFRKRTEYTMTVKIYKDNKLYQILLAVGYFQISKNTKNANKINLTLATFESYLWVSIFIGACETNIL